jgi:hypothetical protein
LAVAVAQDRFQNHSDRNGQPVHLRNTGFLQSGQGVVGNIRGGGELSSGIEWIVHIDFRACSKKWASLVAGGNNKFRPRAGP